MDSIPFNRFMKNNRKQSGNTASPSSNAVPLEDKVHGSVTIKTYYQYFMAGGGYIGCLLTITAFLLAEVAITLADWWPSEWTSFSTGGGGWRWLEVVAIL
jgi:ATP-binding cassette subfamily C (CFTR/MRP) protein 4